MEKIITKIKLYLRRPKGFARLDLIEKACITSLQETDTLNNHLIALARLSLITPERLYNEANNTKANTEYLLTLLEIKKQEESSAN